MPKTRAPSKKIDTRGLLKKVRKPPAPPARVHSDQKKYKRSRVRVLPESEEF
jgi:hypothetical protein